MALNNYENLKKSIIEWSHQDDANLLIPDFIQLTETEMFANDEEILILKTLGKTVELLLINGEVELPDDLIEIRSIKIIGENNTIDLNYHTPQGIDYNNSNLCQYTIIDNKIKTNISSEDTILINYVSESLSLSDLEVSNEVLEKYPNIYLFGALYFLKEWADEPQDAQNYYIRFIKAIRGANKKSKLGKYSSGLQMKHNMKGYL
jgi:hypothetical protein